MAELKPSVDRHTAARGDISDVCNVLEPRVIRAVPTSTGESERPLRTYLPSSRIQNSNNYPDLEPTAGWNSKVEVYKSSRPIIISPPHGVVEW
jgi:hypothetical protein